MVNLDDLGPRCGGVAVVAGIGSWHMPQILALSACERGQGVACVTAGRYALENAADMAALAVDVFVGADEWEPGGKMIEGLCSGGYVDPEDKKHQ